MDNPQTAGESQTPMRRERSAFNKAYLAELDETNDIVRAAQKAGHSSRAKWRALNKSPKRFCKICKATAKPPQPATKTAL